MTIDTASGLGTPDPTNNFSAKWYLNGFPKSGLHYAVQMVRPFVRAMPPGQLRVKPWAGTFGLHSWSSEWRNLPLVLYSLSELQIGCYYKGHCGYHPDIERLLFWSGVCHVFIYRDLRDVAVSQTYHILNDDDTKFIHPGKDKYRALGGFSEVLSAVIVGLDEYPGVVERWGLYAPWLEADWVFKFRFEEARRNPSETAAAIIRYGLARIGALYDLQLDAPGPSFQKMVDGMVASTRNTEQSATFRKGRVGDWRREFTDEHVRLFKETDKDNWLVRLGYANGPDWSKEC